MIFAASSRAMLPDFFGTVTGDGRDRRRGLNRACADMGTGVTLSRSSPGSDITDTGREDGPVQTPSQSTVCRRDCNVTSCVWLRPWMNAWWVDLVAKNRSAYVSCSKLDLVRTVRKTLRSWTLACGELAPCDAVRVIMAVCCHTLRCVVPPEQAEPCGMILASFLHVDETQGVDCGYPSAKVPVGYETLESHENSVGRSDPSAPEACCREFQPHRS